MSHYMLQYLFIVQIRIRILILNIRQVFERICQALDLSLMKFSSCYFSALQCLSTATGKMHTNKKLITYA